MKKTIFFWNPMNSTFNRFAISVIMALVLGGCSESCEGDDGADGASCVNRNVNGKDVTCCPTPGRPGEETCTDYTGAKGDTGSQGPTGPAGSGCTVTQSGDCAVITCGSGSQTVCDGDNGLPGQTGATGPAGPSGSDCTVTRTSDNCVTISCNDGSAQTICGGTSNPGCTPTSENCYDKIDNDCDGYVDSTDPDCQENPNPTTNFGYRYVCTGQVFSNEYQTFKTQTFLQNLAVELQTCLASQACRDSILAGTHSRFGTSYFNEETSQYEVGCWEESFQIEYQGYDGLWVQIDTQNAISGKLELWSGGDLLTAVRTASQTGFSQAWQYDYVNFAGDPGPMGVSIVAANMFHTGWSGQQLMSYTMPSDQESESMTIDLSERGQSLAMRMGNLMPSSSDEAKQFIAIRDQLIPPPPAQE